MPTYRVSWTEQIVRSVDVEADSASEAYDTAPVSYFLNPQPSPEPFLDSVSELKVLSVREITPAAVDHDEILHACRNLDYDGDTATVELPDGRSVTVTLRYDDTDPGEYPDVNGRISACDTRSTREQRPDDFDGSARKVWLDRSTQAWWQPAFPEQAWGDVEETWQRGFCVVTVEVTEQCSCCDRAIVIGSASIGAVDWDAVSDVLRDVVDEALADADA